MKHLSVKFESFSSQSTKFVGSGWVFLSAVGFVLGWLGGGLWFGFTNNWLSFLYAVTGITTFLVVFLIQRSQNKRDLAMNLKLNEIILSLKETDNRLVNVENMPEEALRKLYEFYGENATSNHEELDHLGGVINSKASQSPEESEESPKKT